VNLFNLKKIFYWVLVPLLAGILPFPQKDSFAQDYSQWEGKIIDQISLQFPLPIPIQEFNQALLIQPGEPLNFNRIRESVANLYRLQKFQNVRVEVQKGEEGLTVIFFLYPKIFLEGIFFEGNQTLATSFLRTHVTFKVGEEWFSEDLSKLIEAVSVLYQKEGFFQASIEVMEKVDVQAQKAVLFVSLHEGTPARVSELQFRGELSFSEEKIRKRFKTKKGKIYRAVQFEKDIQNLKSWYVDHGYIEVAIEDPFLIYNIKNNQVELFLSIRPGPKVEVLFQGNEKKSNKKLLEQILVFADRSQDEAVLRDSVERLIEFYRQSGYPFSSITYQKEEPEPGLVRVIFQVLEGPHALLEEITFAGNIFLNSKNLKKLMKTKTGGIFSRGIFLEAVLKEDIVAIQNFYRKSGFLQTQVKWEMVYPKEKTSLSLQFNIEEGVRTFIRGIHFEGNLSFSPDLLRKNIQLKKGLPLNSSLLREDLRSVLSFYSKRGYIYAKIDQEVNFRDDRQQVDIIYRISEDQIAYVSDIQLKGNDYTQDHVILRELLVKKGDVYNYEKVLKSTRRLYRLGYFKEVRFEPIQSEGKNYFRAMDLRIKEKFTGSLEFGGGYGEAEGVVGFVQISQNNLYGTGRKAVLRAQASFENSEYTLSFLEPWLFNYDLDARVGLTYQIQERTSYKLNTYGTTIGLEKDFGDHIKGTLSYQFERNKTDVISPTLVPDDEDRFNIATINPGLVRSTRNDLFNPTSGSLNGIQFRQAARILGSEEQFSKITLRSLWYFPLVSWTVFAVSGSGGMANEFGNSKQVPITERFFLGGRETVRGYKQDSLGPRAQDGTLTGGDVMVNLNYEVRFFLPFKFGLVGFVDSGMVWNEPREINFLELNYSAGWGVRYFTPIGPLRLDIGYKLDPEGGEDPYEIHFTLGQIF
jgi:outer membrane protein insertion porin family